MAKKKANLEFIQRDYVMLATEEGLEIPVLVDVYNSEEGIVIIKVEN